MLLRPRAVYIAELQVWPAKNNKAITKYIAKEKLMVSGTSKHITAKQYLTNSGQVE